MAIDELVVGIDLGTTNSSLAVVESGRPELVPVDGSPLMPSVVGLDAAGELLVGAAAANQYRLYPERTVRSVKRRMGEDVQLELGAQRYAPVEISAMILGRLKRAAEQRFGRAVERAVITVPAYFSEAQRSATKEAGEVAGLRVERILHEPTAAALCYDPGGTQERIDLVYDLGGGTFDVSVVRSRGEVTEVLASCGDSHLGGDDFDELLAGWLAERFSGEAGADPRSEIGPGARLLRAAEETKVRLSVESYARVMLEQLLEVDGVGHNLDDEVSRHEYEALIEPLVSQTKDSIQRALDDAGLLARDLASVILVGGASRTPLVAQMITEGFGVAPAAGVDPDRAVAMGAALQAERIAGRSCGGILVDVTPFTFGTAYLGVLDGELSPHCFRPIIRRNSPLPVRQTEVFYTVHEGQPAVDVKIYQGESEDARDNLELGRFTADGLDPTAPAESPILFDLTLDLDGILQVSVTERHTGRAKGVVIENAFERLDADQVAAAAERVERALGAGPKPPAGTAAAEPVPEQGPGQPAAALRARWAELRERVSAADRDEVEQLIERLDGAVAAGDEQAIAEIEAELSDVLFYLE